MNHYWSKQLFSECVKTMEHSAKSFASFMTSVLLCLMSLFQTKDLNISSFKGLWSHINLNQTPIRYISQICKDVDQALDISASKKY